MFYYILTRPPFLFKNTFVYNEQNKYPHLTNRLVHILNFDQENVEGSESASVPSQNSMKYEVFLFTAVVLLTTTIRKECPN